MAAVVVGGTATAAAARTGADVRGFTIEFFFGEAAGSKNSEHLSGFGTATATVVCSDAHNVSNSNYNVEFLWDRTLQPDDTLKEKFLSYDSAYYKSAGFETRTDRKYHSYVNWSAVPSARDDISGFTSARAGGC